MQTSRLISFATFSILSSPELRDSGCDGSSPSLLPGETGDLTAVGRGLETRTGAIVVDELSLDAFTVTASLFLYQTSADV